MAPAMPATTAARPAMRMGVRTGMGRAMPTRTQARKPARDTGMAHTMPANTTADSSAQNGMAAPMPMVNSAGSFAHNGMDITMLNGTAAVPAYPGTGMDPTVPMYNTAAPAYPGTDMVGYMPMDNTAPTFFLGNGMDLYMPTSTKAVPMYMGERMGPGVAMNGDMGGAQSYHFDYVGVNNNTLPTAMPEATIFPAAAATAANAYMEPLDNQFATLENPLPSTMANFGGPQAQDFPVFTAGGDLVQPNHYQTAFPGANGGGNGGASDSGSDSFVDMLSDLGKW